MGGLMSRRSTAPPTRGPASQPRIGPGLRRRLAYCNDLKPDQNCLHRRLARTLPPPTARGDRYYVGPANGNWNNAANWSTTFGGSGGAGVPDPGTGTTYIVNSDLTVRNISLDTSPSINTLNIGNTSLFTTHLNETATV